MSGELLVVIVPSFVALLVAVLGIFQDSLRLRLIGPRLKVQFEMSEPRRHCADPGSPRRFSGEKLLFSRWSGKLGKVRSVESKRFADTSGEV